MAAIGQTAAQGTPVSAPAGVRPVPLDQNYWQSALSTPELQNLTSQALLEGIGIKNPSTTQLRMMRAWIASEQGAIVTNDNPLSTTLPAQYSPGRIGDWNANSGSPVGIYDYLAHGVAADVKTLNEPAYAGIRAQLAAGNPNGFFTAVGASGWGTSAAGLRGAYNAIPAASVKPASNLQQNLYLATIVEGPPHFNAIAAAGAGLGGFLAPTLIGTLGALGGGAEAGAEGAAGAGAAEGAAGGAAGGSSLSGLSKLFGAKGALSLGALAAVLDPHMFLRVAEAVLGAGLTALGIYALVKDRPGLALLCGIGGYIFLYGGVKDVRPIDEVKAAFGAPS